MAYTVRFATGRGGRTALENELRERGIIQKNGQPNHPQTQGKVERFQQTIKKWLGMQRPRPTSLAELQTCSTPSSTPTTSTDWVSKAGNITVRIAGRLHAIGIGKTYARTYVLALVHDHDIRIINAATGQILRELILDPTRDYQGTGRPPGPAPKSKDM